MCKKYAIGIDGGATKTRVAVKEGMDGEVVFDESFPASNYNNIGVQGIGQVFRSIYETLAQRLSPKGLEEAVLVMGSAGIDRPQDTSVYLTALTDSGFRCPIEVYNDAYIALIGGNGGRHDALVIAGTGSIAIGISKENAAVRAGGWGALMSDEGSGYRIGIGAISAAMRAYDGIDGNTALLKELLDFYKLDSPEAFVDLVYSNGAIPVREIASCAPVVLAQYEKGDSAAAEIIEDEVNGICKMILALGRKMGTEEFRLSTGGSLLLKSEPYFALLRKKLAEAMPLVSLCKPLYEPVQGACILAVQRAGKD
ncbi:MAG: putative N-acetylglucosamine kinase [Bacillota bacterium]|jgi:N-acetylglucosamine kinase-like BadF-type ATPase|nr:putative N-acetylglucosamine kinase [Bacillota bacterium]